ncbi:MAG TPA: carboxypeptidase-like regulatory domain-containing protein [Longimicrobiales bacterium]
MTMIASAPRRLPGALSLLFLVLALLTAGASKAAAQTDVIRGKVTGIDGKGLPGVRVTATSIPGNVTRSATTNGSGSFQIAFPGGPGDYIMGYNLVGFSYRQFQLKRLADEQVLIADIRLVPVQLEAIVAVAPQQQRVSRFAPTPDISGTERAIQQSTLTADQQGDIAAMAASLPGVVLLPGLDGEPDQFSVLGLDGDQNSTTLNGMEFGADGLPRDAAVSTSLSTSPLDPSRGGFSGGNFNINSRAGSNFRSRGMSLVMTTPQMQWTDRAAQALGQDYSSFSLGGMASGPISLNKAFYNVSWQLGRQQRDNQTLLGTSDLGLQTAGVASDSVTRFIDILGDRGVPINGGPNRSNRLSDNGSLFGSVDYSPPSSSSGQSFNLTFSGGWRRQTPVSSGATMLSSAGGDRAGWNGSVQTRHSGYLGLVLSETSLGFNMSRDYGDPYLSLPGGRVRVNSLLADGGNGVQSLTFGGNQNLNSTSTSRGATLQNSLSWFDDANKHRFKLFSELQYNGSEQDQGSNLLGTFTYNSLADLEAGIPASFTRTLTEQQRSSSQLTGAIGIGDSWRYTPDLQFQYTLRMDAAKYLSDPRYNPLVDSTFGVRNDRLPTPITFSPRVGFSWTMGTAAEIPGFAGAFRAPRAVIRGNVGVYSNSSSLGMLGGVLDNTGLPDGIQQINCIGPAVPTPDWATYAADRSAIPTECADGTSGTIFSNSSPNVSLFAKDYSPQKSLRSNLSWNGSILDARFNLNVDGTYSWNLNQQRSVDLNFDPTSRFTLDDGRPVFVQQSSIVPGTGAIASSDARLSSSFARVTELRSDLESRSAQLTLRLSPIPRTPTRFGWSAAYTYQNIREQVSGFNSTSGNPLDVEWARSGQGPHSFNYSLRYNFFDAVNVSWNGTIRSGSAFTPTVAGDINGDGYSNDRAFIYGTDDVDPEVAEGMTQLLANANDRTKDCLQKQLGRIAERNSCRGPWTSTASLNVTLDRAKFRMPQRAEISFSLSNPLGAADLVANGSGNLKGWGQTAFPDQSLLYVRGYNTVSNRYEYEVNQRFGATRPQFMTLRSPVTLTASMRFDLGPTREEQSLMQQLNSGRSQPGSRLPEQFFRQIGSSSLNNPMSTILRSQDSLKLTALQADSIASMNRRYTYRADSLWTPVAQYHAALPVDFDEDAAYDRYIQARRAQIGMLTELSVAIRDLLEPEQLRKLPTFVTNMLDPRYLALVRDGTGMYVGTGGSPGFFFGGGDMMVTEMVVGGAMAVRIMQ